MDEFVRSPEPREADERGIVLGWLAFHRDALEAKCRGLTDEQLIERSAAPSRLSLLGIVRHMAEMERGDGNGHSVRWNLAKLVGEYARHNGHADIIRERIDGQTGE